MKKSTKRLFAALLAATSLLALTACGGGKTEAPKTDDSKTEQPAESSGSKELSVYTAFPESEVIYYFNKFEQETGIKINYVRLSAGEMLTQLLVRSGREEQAMMTTLAGLVVVMMILVQEISGLFQLIKTLFDL